MIVMGDLNAKVGGEQYILHESEKGIIVETCV